jgi:hypothetical protein
MTKPPEASHEQPNFTEQGKLSVEDAAKSQGRRDWLAGPEAGPESESGQSEGDGKVSYGDLKNNQTTHWKVEER